MLENVKSELCGASDGRPCCGSWELRGFLDVWGASSGRRVHLFTDFAPVARHLYARLRAGGGAGVKVLRRARGGFVVTGWVSATLPSGQPETRCCRRSYLRGCFLARGYMNDAARGYHWEIKTVDQPQAEAVRRVIARLGVKGARTGFWQNNWVVYLKDSDQIADWLRCIGAHEALLAFENTRAEKDMRNRVNRRVNYETGNLARTVTASMRQKADIKLIEATIGLANLPPGLKALAEARLAQPLASLAELGASLDPPLGKSGTSHRMRGIAVWAERVKRDLDRRRPELAGDA